MREGQWKWTVKNVVDDRRMCTGNILDNTYNNFILLFISVFILSYINVFICLILMFLYSIYRCAWKKLFLFSLHMCILSRKGSNFYGTRLYCLLEAELAVEATKTWSFSSEVRESDGQSMSDVLEINHWPLNHWKDRRNEKSRGLSLRRCGLKQ